MKFKDKVVVITGGTAGIGRAAAIKFGQEGAKVVIVSVSEKHKDESIRALSELNIDFLYIKGDVSNSIDAQRIIKTTIETYGKLDILVNAAGIVLAGRADNTTESDWNRTIDINLKGVFLVSKYAILEMLTNGGGVIVNIASSVALKGVKDRFAYTASKGAIVSITRAMAIDYIDKNIRVNCICPGTTLTPSLEDRISEKGNKEQALKEFIERQPMGRLGKDTEIAEAILFASSNETEFMNGSIISIDGGMTI